MKLNVIVNTGEQAKVGRWIWYFVCLAGWYELVKGLVAMRKDIFSLQKDVKKGFGLGQKDSDGQVSGKTKEAQVSKPGVLRILVGAVLAFLFD